MSSAVASRTVVRTPTVLENDETESGAAALCSVLAYYEKYLPLEEVLTASGAGRRGGDPDHLCTAAINYGMEARVAPLTVDEVKEAEGPLLAFMGNGRFVVVGGFRKGCFVVGDTVRGSGADEGGGFPLLLPRQGHPPAARSQL